VKLDTPLDQLRYFLQDELYLLKADKEVYRNPETNLIDTEEADVTSANDTAAFLGTKTASATAAATISTHATETASATATPPPAPTFKHLGNNLKNFLILAHYPAEQFMAGAHLTALLNTITRLNFSQDDVAIVNLSQYPGASWPQLLEFFKPVKLLILGNDALPAQMPNLPQNEVQQLDACHSLYTFSFDEMMGNKENTKAFWNQIKTY